jgi:hypothetical protein
LAYPAKLTDCGRGYSTKTLSGETSFAHRVIGGPTLGFHSAERTGNTNMLKILTPSQGHLVSKKSKLVHLLIIEYMELHGIGLLFFILFVNEVHNNEMVLEMNE